MLCHKKSLHESCRMGRCIVVMKLICSLCHSECDNHTVHKVSQRRLTADWLAPLESDCSGMHSKVSSDWLTSYINATRPVLEIFKMAGYFPDSPRTLSFRAWFGIMDTPFATRDNSLQSSYVLNEVHLCSSLSPDGTHLAGSYGCHCRWQMLSHN